MPRQKRKTTAVVTPLGGCEDTFLGIDDNTFLHVGAQLPLLAVAFMCASMRSTEDCMQVQRAAQRLICLRVGVLGCREKWEGREEMEERVDYRALFLIFSFFMAVLIWMAFLARCFVRSFKKGEKAGLFSFLNRGPEGREHLPEAECNTAQSDRECPLSPQPTHPSDLRPPLRPPLALLVEPQALHAAPPPSEVPETPSTPLSAPSEMRDEETPAAEMNMSLKNTFFTFRPPREEGGGNTLRPRTSQSLPPLHLCTSSDEIKAHENQKPSHETQPVEHEQPGTSSKSRPHEEPAAPASRFGDAATQTECLRDTASEEFHKVALTDNQQPQDGRGDSRVEVAPPESTESLRLKVQRLEERNKFLEDIMTVRDEGEESFVSLLCEQLETAQQLLTDQRERIESTEESCSASPPQDPQDTLLVAYRCAGCME
uniref:Uncharacterized protein n=1 Tax=Chromera velia CCMP2878 TaxID=1169474 RepID=A0A0K6S8J4_9ALVE|eukprot:Cvel_24672.t2-p1 / transcript=Cvel_24672.t2 / gene=Cvel_24672 / organism=Chromera_velia_CCMP2878 / gene_product=hypothetical protein / transcript_product=hypothetical protein / location=Cvel_scaffold2700:10063-11625(+) / protein_length=428 / sequence_SO=supercontig / SO=protein_coding / is_pseudo=false